MKKILCSLLIFCLLCSLAACGAKSDAYVPTGDALVMEDETPAEENYADENGVQELNMIYYKDLTMNPYKCADYTNRALFSLIYQGLFTVDSNYHAEPMLCSYYSYSDDLYAYTFYIDENATFSDGTKLTAADVVASLNTAFECDIYRGRFYFVAGAELGDDGAVVVNLYHAYEDLPILLDVPIIKASQITNDHPLGTGPYSLVKTLTGGRLVRRSNWWCDAEIPIDLPYITLFEAQSASQIRDEFQFRDLNLVCTDPGSGLYADYLCDYELWDCENGYFLYLACKNDSPIFSSDSVRSALTYAIDRDLIVDGYYRGHARSATLPASPASPYYNSALASRYAYAPEKFTSAVEGAGLKGATVSILVNADDSVRLQVAKEIGKMLEACGLKAELMAETSSSFQESLMFSEYDLYVGMTRLSANMDLSQFFAPYGSLSYAGLDDAEMFGLCLNALSNSGNYYALHKAIMDTGAICPILFRSYAIYATRGMIQDLHPARDAIFYYSIGKTMDDALIEDD